jgi:hypothetical protein
MNFRCHDDFIHDSKCNGDEVTTAQPHTIYQFGCRKIPTKSYHLVSVPCWAHKRQTLVNSGRLAGPTKTVDVPNEEWLYVSR